MTDRRGHLPRRLARVAALTALTLLVAVTAGSFGYNLATDGPAPRPSGLLFARGGGFETRYRQWGTSGPPVVLVPGAFETADTYYALGPALAAAGHRVFAIDLTGTGYSAPSPPFDASHLARQLLAFEEAKGLTGPDAPVLLGHSSGAAVVGLAALAGSRYARGVVFLDGDATPLSRGGGGGFLGSLLINPFKTTLIRLALSQDWLVTTFYEAMCGPTCPKLDSAGVAAWRDPLLQPGFEEYLTDEASHGGIPSMTPGQFRALRAAPVPKLVVFGRHDPQMPASDARATAAAIGAPPPEFVPGRHLTMIASPRPVAADVSRAFSTRVPGPR